jgi:hypothetical protein
MEAFTYEHYSERLIAQKQIEGIFSRSFSIKVKKRAAGRQGGQVGGTGVASVGGGRGAAGRGINAQPKLAIYLLLDYLPAPLLSYVVR